MESLFLVWLELVLIKSLNLNMDCACKMWGMRPAGFFWQVDQILWNCIHKGNFICISKKKKLISRRISQRSVCRLYVVCQEAPCFSGCRESLWQLSLKRWKWARYVCINFHLNIHPRRPWHRGNAQLCDQWSCRSDSLTGCLDWIQFH